MLLTTPLTLSDGSANHIFNWLRQDASVPPTGLYIETAADPSLEKRIKTSHTSVRRNGKRHLVSLSGKYNFTGPDADGVTAGPIVANFTIYHNALHSAATIELVLQQAQGLIKALTAAKLAATEI